MRANQTAMRVRPWDAVVYEQITFSSSFDSTEASADDSAAQVEEAVLFLTVHRDELARLMATTGVEGAELDFGIERRDVAVQCDTLPAPLICFAGALGLAIAMSLYPEMDDSEEL